MNQLPSNVTYRQFDHWCTKGYINGGKEVGTGNYRRLDDHELRVLREMGKLVESGLTPLLASAVARDLLEHGYSRLPGGYVIKRAT